MSLRLLCIFAHPDDECFAFGGALALAADRGVDVRLACLTDGQAGSYRGSATTPVELGQLRRAEFAASCRILGVQHHEVLDYQDGQLEFADFSKLAGLLVERIRSLRPDVVVTFGMDGAPNTHPDHTVVSAATTAAVHWAASPKRYPELGPVYVTPRLYHQTQNFFLEGRPQPLPSPWTLTLDIRPVFQRKIDAFRAHTTQAPLLAQVLPVFEEHGQEEFYTLMATPYAQPAEQATDMFAGLAE
jgi:LmbE family N-acetylglucosaminyl deacetylase